MTTHLIASGLGTSTEEHMSRLMHCFESAEVLEVGETPVGLLKVVRSSQDWDLLQIQLLPEHQGTGLGSEVLRDLIEQASTAGAAITLSVLKVNPARSLYERLGFVMVSEDDQSYEMRRKA